MTVTQRAVQIWPVLVFAARNRQLLTYETLAELVGVPAQGLGQCLGPIQAFCLVNDLPPLTVLVVQKDTGLPGVGFTAAAEIPSAQARVFGHDWSAQRCPTTDEFAAAAQR